MLELLLMLVLLFIFWSPVVMNMLGPVVIWKKQKVPAAVKLRAVDEKSFILARRESFRQYDRELKLHGFKSNGSSWLEDSQTVSHFRIYSNSEKLLAAMVVSVESDVEETTYIELFQIYEDESVLVINNSNRIDTSPKVDFKDVFNFPESWSVSEITGLFYEVKGKIKPDAIPMKNNKSCGFNELERFIKKESDMLMERGFLREHIDAEGWRRLTLTGAFSMTVRSVPPGDRVFNYFRNKRQERLLGKI